MPAFVLSMPAFVLPMPAWDKPLFSQCLPLFSQCLHGISQVMLCLVCTGKGPRLLICAKHSASCLKCTEQRSLLERIVLELLIPLRCTFSRLTDHAPCVAPVLAIFGPPFEKSQAQCHKTGHTDALLSTHSITVQAEPLLRRTIYHMDCSQHSCTLVGRGSIQARGFTLHSLCIGIHTGGAHTCGEGLYSGKGLTHYRTQSKHRVRTGGAHTRGEGLHPGKGLHTVHSPSMGVHTGGSHSWGGALSRQGAYSLQYSPSMWFTQGVHTRREGLRSSKGLDAVAYERHQHQSMHSCAHTPTHTHTHTCTRTPHGRAPFGSGPAGTPWTRCVQSWRILGSCGTWSARWGAAGGGGPCAGPPSSTWT